MGVRGNERADCLAGKAIKVEEKAKDWVKILNAVRDTGHTKFSGW